MPLLVFVLEAEAVKIFYLIRTFKNKNQGNNF